MNLFVRYVSADQMKLFTAPYLNVVSRNLILTAIQSIHIHLHSWQTGIAAIIVLPALT